MELCADPKFSQVTNTLLTCYSLVLIFYLMISSVELLLVVTRLFSHLGNHFVFVVCNIFSHLAHWKHLNVLANLGQIPFCAKFLYLLCVQPVYFCALLHALYCSYAVLIFSFSSQIIYWFRFPCEIVFLSFICVLIFLIFSKCNIIFFCIRVKLFLDVHVFAYVFIIICACQ